LNHASFESLAGVSFVPSPTGYANRSAIALGGSALDVGRSGKGEFVPHAADNAAMTEILMATIKSRKVFCKLSADKNILTFLEL
jgi:hypothetical protein